MTTVAWQGNLATNTVTLEKYNNDFNKTEKNNRIKQDTHIITRKRITLMPAMDWVGLGGGGMGKQCLGRKTLGILYVFYCSQDNFFVVRIINRRITIQIQIRVNF